MQVPIMDDPKEVERGFAVNDTGHQLWGLTLESSEEDPGMVELRPLAPSEARDSPWLMYSADEFQAEVQHDKLAWLVKNSEQHFRKEGNMLLATEPDTRVKYARQKILKAPVLL